MLNTRVDRWIGAAASGLSSRQREYHIEKQERD